MLKEMSTLLNTYNHKMDLNQRKLNKSEWESIEVPVSKSEIDILNMIIAGYQDVNIRINNNNSIFAYFSFLRIVSNCLVKSSESSYII